MTQRIAAFPGLVLAAFAFMSACSSDPDVGFPTGSSGSGGAGANGGAAGVAGSISSGGSSGSSQGGSAGVGGDLGGVGGSAGSADGGVGGSSGSGAGGTGGSIPSGACGAEPTEASASKAGPMAMKSYTTGLPDSPSYGAATVYYPDGPGPYPGVAVAPGFTEAQSAIAGWGRFLATHCFVVLALDTNSPLDQPDVRATALYAAVGTLKGENARSGSPIMGKVDTNTMAVMGHSMGGGGTLLAATAHPDLKAAIGLCPWIAGAPPYQNDKVPSMIFAGSIDNLATPAMTKPEYDAIPASTSKLFVEFQGADHFVSNDPAGGPQAALVARYGLSWLKIHMNGDARYKQFIVKQSPFSRFETTLK